MCESSEINGSLRRISSSVIFTCAMLDPFAGATGLNFLLKFQVLPIPRSPHQVPYLSVHVSVLGPARVNSTQGLHARAASSPGRGFSGAGDGAGGCRTLFRLQSRAQGLRAR